MAGCRMALFLAALSRKCGPGSPVMLIDIDPKVDYAFKGLFGREATRPLLIHLADAVLDPPPDAGSSRSICSIPSIPGRRRMTSSRSSM